MWENIIEAGRPQMTIQDFYLTTHNTHNIQTSVFKSVIPIVYLRTEFTNTCRKAVKNTTIFVIYSVLVYIQISVKNTTIIVIYRVLVYVQISVKNTNIIVIYRVLVYVQISVKNTTIIVIYRVLVYVQISVKNNYNCSIQGVRVCTNLGPKVKHNCNIQGVVYIQISYFLGLGIQPEDGLTRRGRNM